MNETKVLRGGEQPENSQDVSYTLEEIGADTLTVTVGGIQKLPKDKMVIISITITSDSDDDEATA